MGRENQKNLTPKNSLVKIPIQRQNQKKDNRRGQSLILKAREPAPIKQPEGTVPNFEGPGTRANKGFFDHKIEFGTILFKTTSLKILKGV